MTNGENVTRIVEQNEDFCILTDDVAETVTIEVSLDWWNKPNAPTVDVFDEIRNEIEQVEINGHIRDVECFRAGINTVLNVIEKYRGDMG